MNKTIIDLQNMCRTCMMEFPKTQGLNVTKKQNILEVAPGTEDKSIVEILQLVQPKIKVEIKNNFPMLMCSNCIDKLLIAHGFMEMCKNSDMNLRKILGDDINDFGDGKVDNIEDSCDEEEKEYSVYGINEYAQEIEELNSMEVEKEEENDIDWTHLISQLSNDNEEYFINPYSDGSDNESQHNDAIKDGSGSESKHNDTISQNKTLTKGINKNQNLSNDETNNDTSINNCDLKRKFTRKRVKTVKELLEENEMPDENIDGKIQCRICNVVVDNADLWREHMIIHRNIVRTTIRKSLNCYICKHCGKGFGKSARYRSHLLIHSEEKPYLCSVCGKTFRLFASYRTHLLIHKGEKNFQCQQCPKKFVCSSGLYNHMMVHTKVKPFVCDICGSAFHMSIHLKKHKMYHNGPKNFPCEFCDKSFILAEKQRRHMRTHTGEKPYSCKYCDKAFAQSNDHVKHLRQHLGNNVYQCELCPQRFPLARDLRVHFANHKDDDEETRARNSAARIKEEKKLNEKMGIR